MYAIIRICLNSFGTGDSILLTLVYRKIDITDRYTNIYKYIHRKYNIRSYQNMPEFFEDK